MKSKSLLTLAALCIAGFLIWPGCAWPTITTSRKPLTTFKTGDFSSRKIVRLSRDEVITKLGKPDEDFADLRVVCYKVNKVNRTQLLLLFFVIPVAASPSPRLEVAMIEFDDHDQAKRIEFRTVSGYSNSEGLRWAAKEWLKIPPNQ